MAANLEAQGIHLGFPGLQAALISADLPPLQHVQHLIEGVADMVKLPAASPGSPKPGLSSPDPFHGPNQAVERLEKSASQIQIRDPKRTKHHCQQKPGYGIKPCGIIQKIAGAGHSQGSQGLFRDQILVVIILYKIISLPLFILHVIVIPSGPQRAGQQLIPFLKHHRRSQAVFHPNRRGDIRQVHNSHPVKAFPAAHSGQIWTVVQQI